MDKIIAIGRDIDFSELSKFLMKHQAMENDSLYPKLNKELKEKEREYILEKISKFRVKYS